MNESVEITIFKGKPMSNLHREQLANTLKSVIEKVMNDKSGISGIRIVEKTNNVHVSAS